MSNISYKNHNNQQQLFIENLPLQKIVNEVDTPFYCYSKKAIIDNFNKFDQSFKNNDIRDYKICYAIKANYNREIVKILIDLGCGIDAVSAGEIEVAISSGANPKKIVFAGVGKTRSEIEYALKSGVREFSVESIPEMYLLNEVAINLNVKAKFLLRVNPDVDANTHDKISTGRKTDKFGVDINLAESIYDQAANLEGLDVCGIATHIGSQITKIKPFVDAFNKIRDLCISLRKNGHNIKILDFGGGIGIKYNDEEIFAINDYVKLINDLTRDLQVTINIAPGRAMVGDTGFLVTNVTYIKETDQKNFAIIDAGMNDLARPGLYGSYHKVLPLLEKTGFKKEYDLAGPVCETTDILAKNRFFDDLMQDDILVFCDAGAYGSSMSNQYNCRPLIAEILIDDNSYKIIREKKFIF